MTDTTDDHSTYTPKYEETLSPTCMTPNESPKSTPTTAITSDVQWPLSFNTPSKNPARPVKRLKAPRSPATPDSDPSLSSNTLPVARPWTVPRPLKRRRPPSVRLPLEHSADFSGTTMASESSSAHGLPRREENQRKPVTTLRTTKRKREPRRSRSPVPCRSLRMWSCPNLKR
jgi:hypothetical protein